MKSCTSCFSVIATLCAVAMAMAPAAHAEAMGRFNKDTDLLLLHFDSKTDVDDIHSIAGAATMLAHPRLSKVRHHAVAGAYGIQKGLYVPANELFELAFPKRWSDAHADRNKALEEVAAVTAPVLENGGNVWIAEAGQSDFSALLVKRMIERFSEELVKSRIHLVQHSKWNENQASPEALAFVREHTDYHKIPDGNTVGNGTPGFKSAEPVNWRNHVTDPDLVAIWSMAIDIANRYNGVDGRFMNPAIQAGGLDFSDVSEICWILGYGDLVDANDFFAGFASPVAPTQ